MSKQRQSGDVGFVSAIINNLPVGPTFGELMELDEAAEFLCLQVGSRLRDETALPPARACMLLLHALLGYARDDAPVSGVDGEKLRALRLYRCRQTGPALQSDREPEWDGYTYPSDRTNALCELPLRMLLTGSSRIKDVEGGRGLAIERAAFLDVLAPETGKASASTGAAISASSPTAIPSGALKGTAFDTPENLKILSDWYADEMRRNHPRMSMSAVQTMMGKQWESKFPSRGELGRNGVAGWLRKAGVPLKAAGAKREAHEQKRDTLESVWLPAPERTAALPNA